MSNIFQKNKTNWWWIGLGSLTVLVRILLGNFPHIIEKYYSQGFFLGIRTVIDSTVGLLPIPLIYLFFIVLIISLFVKIRKLIQTHISFKNTLGKIVFSLITFLFGLAFFFLVLWGFNYGRVPVEQTLKINPQPLSLVELKTELDQNHQAVVNARNQIPKISSSPIDATFLPTDIENTIRKIVEEELHRLGYKTSGKVRGRLLTPKGILMRIGTSGVYFPWTGECNIDSGLHPVQIPFTLAHEFCHGYGFTDEGTCNFLAYLACIHSDNPMVQYSGFLGYWRYLASSYRRMDPENYKTYFDEIPKGILNDVIAIDKEIDKYPDIFPDFRDAFYDTYLKTQGISEGMKNYSRIVMLAKAWRYAEKN